MSRDAALVAAFAQAYGRAHAGAVRAPGRVNLIGEHTDYNDGFCLPMAIERDVRVLWAPRADALCTVCSLEQPGKPVQFVLEPQALMASKPTPWSDYVKGCAKVLLAHGVALKGCDLVVSGNVPLGSGLSSSAALEVAIIHALLACAGQQLDATTIAVLGQRAENTFVGTNCGILDQLSSSCGMLGRAMLMDCRTKGLSPVPLPQGYSVVIADTGKRRGLVDSAYNERRAQCEAGTKALGVSHLRDVTLHGLWQAHQAGRLDALAARRCAYVVAENGRTQAAAAVLRAGDAVAFGQLMDQSHAGLRDDFAVSCAELDTMVALARSLPGCLGSRMTGAGFGGCTVSLVASEAVKAFVRALETQYRTAFPSLTPAVYVTGAAAGAGVYQAA